MSEQKSIIDRWKTDSIPTSAFSQCTFCIHKHKKDTCKAFECGIPEEIIKNKFIHNKPYPGDNGIIYIAESPKYENINFTPFVKKKLY